MNDPLSRDDGQQALRLELYKGLRAEAGKYLEKIPGIWLQKFVLMGTTLAFLLTQQENLVSASTGVASDTIYDLALCTIAALAILIDAKILEYSLHARVISRFIGQRFADLPLLSDWEHVLWGEAGPAYDILLVRRRSLTTVAVTAAPTIIVIFLVGLVVGARRDSWIAQLLLWQDASSTWS